MPKVTKKTVSKKDAPKRNSKTNEISTQEVAEEDQPVVTIVDKTDESTSQKGVKRKPSSVIEKVQNNLIDD